MEFRLTILCRIGSQQDPKLLIDVKKVSPLYRLISIKKKSAIRRISATRRLGILCLRIISTSNRLLAATGLRKHVQRRDPRHLIPLQQLIRQGRQRKDSSRFGFLMAIGRKEKSPVANERAHLGEYGSGDPVRESRTAIMILEKPGHRLQRQGHLPVPTYRRKPTFCPSSSHKLRDTSIRLIVPKHQHFMICQSLVQKRL
jgi:hypothetical protein